MARKEAASEPVKCGGIHKMPHDFFMAVVNDQFRLICRKCGEVRNIA